MPDFWEAVLGGLVSSVVMLSVSFVMGSVVGLQYLALIVAPSLDPNEKTEIDSVFIRDVRKAYWIAFPIGFLVCVPMLMFVGWEQSRFFFFLFVVLSWFLYWIYASRRLRKILQKKSVRWEFFLSATTLGIVAAIMGIGMIEQVLGWMGFVNNIPPLK